jgi:hypothetical protein
VGQLHLPCKDFAVKLVVPLAGVYQTALILKSYGSTLIYRSHLTVFILSSNIGQLSTFDPQGRGKLQSVAACRYHY